MKSKTSAALLAFFLGGFGMHQFYLGNTKKGITYLLFFWTLIPALIALVDFIKLVTKSQQDFDQEYNTATKVAAKPQKIIAKENFGFDQPKEPPFVYPID